MSWKDMTARNITEWYLYGEDEKAPTGDGFLDAKYIRSGKPNDGDNPAFTIEFTKEDFYDFMTDTSSPTRFGSITQIPVVQKFFEEDIDWPDGEYYIYAKDIDDNLRKTNNNPNVKLINDMGSEWEGANTYDGLTQYNYIDSSITNEAESKKEYGERVHVWNSQAYHLSHEAMFVVTTDAQGNKIKSIKNYSLFIQNSDDFDFVGGFAGNIGTGLFSEPDIDPSGIGRNIKFDYPYMGSRVKDLEWYETKRDTELGVLTLSKDEFLTMKETHEKNKTGGVNLYLKEAIDSVADELWKQGVTKFIDSEGRPVLYGSMDSDTISDPDDYLPVGRSYGLFDGKLEQYWEDNEELGYAIVAGASADTLIGDDYDDMLIGGEGNDTIYGGAGNDTIYTNTKNGIDNETAQTTNTVYAGDGADTIYGSKAKDIIYGDSDDATNPNQYTNQDIIYGGEGSDTIYGGKGGDTIYTNQMWIGGEDNEGTETTNTVYGGEGADEIHGSNGVDIIYGGKGNDTISTNVRIGVG